ncbi:putative N(4)-(beta-N-acetylglucosaminyl)-L-asparaginase GE19290 [Episyrphus balteatus]|uniref:putative N(4)-(beta-N-acetylglucosaminyl)-L-asparaginase GE19290 n=1 Tax=Episyrphus balteatus TaxID=286459 RepID=UPI0024859D45|nr:putative N(4)-(beta-N-acetylglucosaminyl)-L-asparaginase GE19290 [Episyrphus balteatus]
MTVILVALTLTILSQGVISSNLPIVINTWAFIDAANEAWKVLHQPHKTALDALVEGCSTCERLQCDGTVGYGGSPDEHGETTLDAMIMDGANMNIGAVAALRHIKHAARVARHVLENTQHTLLVGDQATQFAQTMGFKKESLSTPASKEIWQKWWHDGCQPNFWINVNPDPKSSCGPYKPSPNYNPLSEIDKEKFEFGSKNHDTIGMIVIDSSGHIYAGTSTNGANHKIPGRVGDSPIPGAGAYADNEFGAAAATGDGDIMMRFLPSFVAVENLRAGQDTTTAAQNAIKRILKHHEKFMGGLIVVNRLGEIGAACTGIDKFPYSVAFGNQTKAKIEYIDC